MSNTPMTPEQACFEAFHQGTEFRWATAPLQARWRRAAFAAINADLVREKYKEALIKIAGTPGNQDHRDVAKNALAEADVIEKYRGTIDGVPVTASDEAWKAVMSSEAETKKEAFPVYDKVPNSPSVVAPFNSETEKEECPNSNCENGRVWWSHGSEPPQTVNCPAPCHGIGEKQ